MSLSWNRLLQGALLTGAIALLPAYRLAFEPAPASPVLALTTQSLTGTVVGTGEADENEWLLETRDGIVIIDAGPRWYQEIALELSETITVEGEFDDDEFDVFTITRADGTLITVRPTQGRPPWAGGRRQQARPDHDRSADPVSGGATLAGTIVGRGEADENEWRVQTPNGIIIVDAGDRDDQVIDLELGEAVIITGEFDEGEFDAFTITRADGTVIEVLAVED